MHTKKILIFLILFSTVCSFNGLAQQGKKTGTDTTSEELGSDLLKMLSDEQNSVKKKKEFVTATFKATRIINGHSIENDAKGVLDFRISHRFGRLSEGSQNFYGLDDATTKIGFDYGITNWLMVGIAHSTFQKEDDGFVKIKLFRQTTNNSMPVSISYLGDMSVQTTPAPSLPAGETYDFNNRLYYANQLLIARKFNDMLSLQLMPSYVHYNLVALHGEPNDVMAIGVGGRIKLSQRFALTGEYYYVLPGASLAQEGYCNSLSIGVDIETGGHVFQLMLTNATGITERTFIGQTTDDWGKGQIHFGFNISRMFTVVRPKEFKDTRNNIY